MYWCIFWYTQQRCIFWCHFWALLFNFSSDNGHRAKYTMHLYARRVTGILESDDHIHGCILDVPGTGMSLDNILQEW